MMKTILLIAILLVARAGAARAALNVVATLPDFAAIALAVGGDHVKVTALAKGTEDAHFVDARPSFIRLLNQADVLLEGGAELEAGWLPPLVNNARNPKILPGGAGHVIMARGIRLLDTMRGPVDRSQGDVHAAGNPHFWLDPANGKIMAGTIAEAFGRLDPRHVAAYQANLARFNERLTQGMTEWTKRLEPYRGTKALSYHKSYEYLADRFDFQIVAQIEPKPGLEPSPTHINVLIPRAKEQGARLVLIEPFRSRKTPEYVARAIGAKLLVLPDKVGATAGAGDYFALFDTITADLAGALAAGK